VKKIKFLKNAGILLVIAALIFSTSAVTANTISKQTTPTLSTTSAGAGQGARGEIVWDNGMDYIGLAAAQWDETIQFDTYQADDFEFTEATEVCDVHWVGGYWNPDPYAEFDWGISFYLDDGTGTAPLGTPYAPSYAGPFIFTWSEITWVELEEGYYEMSVDLPDNIPFDEGHYWISIWGIGTYPPQCGWGYHDTFLLSPAVWGSVYFAYPFWTPGFDVQGFDFDMAFQLTTKTEAIPAICCVGSLTFTDVSPAGEVTGTFEVCNCGEEGSLLDWQFDSAPTWPGAIFEIEPDSGVDLAYDDCVEITVTITAPDVAKETFTGKIKMINQEDPTDYCEVSVTLTTPRTRSIFVLFEQFLQQFPLLQYILGL